MTGIPGRSLWLVTFLVLGFLSAAPALARAQSAIALQGEVAPSTGGGTFEFLDRPVINDAGQVAFRALVTGGTTSEGVFLDPGSGLTAVAVSGGLAPDTGGATFTTLGEPEINGSGQVAFSASLQGGSATRGLFLHTTGGLMAIATSETTAPETDGGRYSAFGTRISLNDSAEVAFFANVSDGDTTGGIFVEGGVAGRAVFLAGEAAPAGVNGTYFNFTSPAINAAGDVAVTVSIFVDPSFADALVVQESGTARLAALAGDAAPDSGGGTYSFFNFFSPPAINASGDVFFRSSVVGGLVGSGLFVDSAGVHSAVVLENDLAPGDVGGADFFRFANSGLSVNDAGDVGYSASLLSGSVGEGLFVSSVGDPGRAVALLGEAVPSVGSGTYVILGESPSINASAAAAFRANFTGGSAASAILVVPEPSAAIGAITVVLLVSLVSRTRRARPVG